MCIIKETILLVADNSGAKRVRCIGMYNNRKYAKVGDILMVSVQSVHSKSNILKGSKYKAIVVRTKYAYNRGPSTFSFSNNAVVLLNDKLLPIGNRVFGVIIRDINSIIPEVGNIAEQTC